MERGIRRFRRQMRYAVALSAGVLLGCASPGKETLRPFQAVPRPHPVKPGVYPPNARTLLVHLESDGVHLRGTYPQRGLRPLRSVARRAGEARSGRVILVGFQAWGEKGEVVGEGWLPVEAAPRVEWTDPDDPTRIRCAEVSPGPMDFVLDIPTEPRVVGVRFWKRIPGEGPDPDKWAKAPLGEIRLH